MESSSKNIEKLCKFLKNNDEAILITSDINRAYFSGFSSSAGVMLVTYEHAYLLVDFRYSESAKNIVKNCSVITYNKLFDELNTLICKHLIKSLYIESTQVSVNYYNNIKKIFAPQGVSIISNNSLDTYISNIRMIKSSYEIEMIQEAQKITELAFWDVLNFIKPGVSEIKIALEFEYLMKKNGAQSVAFDLITITGSKTSLPHGVPDEQLIKSGDFFTMDVGAVFNGYHSDMTRTVGVECITEKQRNVYNTVLKAQLTALENVRSGVFAKDIDKIARDIIYSAGYEECFGHGTGHGVGAEIHEAPTIGPNSKTILSSGMVITIEPGIYLPGEFGVRIEDMVLVKTDTYQNFATISKDLIIV